MSGVVFTTTLSGQKIKYLTCEQCAGRYVYQMSRRVDGSAGSVMNIDVEGAKRRASELAERRMNAALNHECDPVPCPDCGWYQTKMLPAVRDQYYPWVRFTGYLSLIACVAFFYLTYLDSFSSAASSSGHMGLAVLFLAGGVGLFRLRAWLASRCDPNQEDAEARKRIGQSRAMRRAEFDAMMTDTPVNELP